MANEINLKEVFKDIEKRLSEIKKEIGTIEKLQKRVIQLETFIEDEGLTPPEAPGHPPGDDDDDD